MLESIIVLWGLVGLLFLGFLVRTFRLSKRIEREWTALVREVRAEVHGHDVA